MYPLQVLAYHLSMLVVLGLLLRRMRSRFRKTGKPAAAAFFAINCCWGLIASLVLAVVIGWLTTGWTAGQRFAEGLFFEGSAFLFLAGRMIAAQRKAVGNTARAQAFFPRCLQLFAVIVLGIGLYSLYYEPWALQVKTYRIETDRLVEPLRIVLITDIQTDRFGEYEYRALETAKAQNADLILFGGDYVQYDSGSTTVGRRDFNRLLRTVALSAPLGVFAVEGNHELFQPGWAKAFEGTGIEASYNSRSLLLKRPNDAIRLSLLTFPDSHPGNNRRRSPANFEQEPHSSDFSEEATYHIMLGHDPSLAAGKGGADLLLAGHTHGGQVCLPFFGPIITFAKGIPLSWGKGKTILPDGSTLIISNGVGLERREAPRIRFCCPPQIVVVDLVPHRES